MAESPLKAEALKAAVIRALEDGMTPEVSQPPASPAKRSHTPMHLALGVMGGGQVADAMTTASALKRAGTQESNPLYGTDPSMARVLGTKAAIMGPLGWLLDKSYDKHPKAALIAALATGGLGMGLAARNAKQGKK